MPIARRDNKVPFVVRQSAQRGLARVDQAAQQRRAGGLRRALLAADHHDRIGTAATQAGERVGDRQDEVVVAIHAGTNVKQRPQSVDRAVPLGLR